MAEQEVAALCAEADKLERASKWREAYDMLKPHAGGARDPELLWRIVRAYYRMGKYLTKDKHERDLIAEEGMALSERALQIDPNNFNVQKVLQEKIIAVCVAC
jgi:protein-disulfide isomerase-like protein with CxxC motif